MTGAPHIAIEQLVLPVSDVSAAAAVADALRGELARRHAADAAAGIVWRAHVERLVIDLPEGLDPDAIGRAIAAEWRRRAVAGDGA